MLSIEHTDPTYLRHKKQRGFGHGGLRLILLYLLQQKTQHAYELMNDVEELSYGLYRPSTGALYPVLNQLVEDQYLDRQDIAQDSEHDDLSRRAKTKVSYRITETGRAEYQRHATHIEHILERVKQRASRPLVVVRAIENLKYAVHLKLEQQGLTVQQAQQLAAVLDQAVQKIDQI